MLPFMTDISFKRILSIQSSVSWGYCGNKSATFPLQLLGYDVSTINTVQFSNHTGYGHWRGQSLTYQHLMDLYKGLKENDFIREYQFLLTGYVPGKEGVESILHISKDLKEVNPSIGWLLDPVLGDQGRFYVSEEVIPVYKQLIPMCDLITPNQFESRLFIYRGNGFLIQNRVLSGEKITSFDTLLYCLEVLHKKYNLKHIVISSVQFSSNNKELHVIASSCKSDYTPRAVKITVPYYDYVLVGIGDLFSALLLGQFGSHIKSTVPDEIDATLMPLSHALELVVASVQAVIRNTVKSILNNPVYQKEQLSTAQMFKLSELCIIQSQDELKNPTVEYKACRLSTAFDAFMLELEYLNASPSLPFSFPDSQLVLENGSGEDLTNKDFWLKKAEELVNLEKQIDEYRENKTLENIGETLTKLQDEINQTLQIYFPI
ncbi:hypothetical protein PORY_000747 [Pneumocystis oryctolagi]|uniref:Uncharacterized protein n=1 Tax=Pneumocystis oryctolagi TaxID=42067 RepID=A0ACB7CDJ5_9ASCO|nr:hypothetical protein PORY_000747 [Pneumocystis oryctolagi]